MILFLILINTNMRCIEISVGAGMSASDAKINTNMRCIEICYSLMFSDDGV